MPEPASSMREQIIGSGERLFARHGIDGVSLRQIGADAGNANNSAVQYHFGSKDQLVRAIFDYRLGQLGGRRDRLVAERRPADLRSWIECQARSLLEQSEVVDSHYLGFVAMLIEYHRLDVLATIPEPFAASSRHFVERVRALLPDLPEAVRGHRISRVMELVIHTAAHRERALGRAQPVLPFELVCGDLVDGITGYLTAPVSAEVHATLDDVVPADASWSGRTW